MTSQRMLALRRRWPLARWAVPIILLVMLLPFLWLL